MKATSPSKQTKQSFSSHPLYKILSFEKIQNVNKQQDKYEEVFLSRHDRKNGFINIVILDFKDQQESQGVSNELFLLQNWLKQKQTKIKLFKLTQLNGFLQLYKEFLSSNKKTIFISTLPLEKLKLDPIKSIYQEYNKQQQHTNETVASINHKISYLILNKNIQSISNQNYLHDGVKLITSQVEKIQAYIDKELEKYVHLREISSTSTINSKDEALFNENFNKLTAKNTSLEGLTKIYPEDRQGNEDLKKEQMECLRIMHNTPGVGSYNVSPQKMDSTSGKFERDSRFKKL